MALATNEIGWFLMALATNEMTLITARSGIARAGASRMGSAQTLSQMEAGGKVIWKRPKANNGNPDDTASTWVKGKT